MKITSILQKNAMAIVAMATIVGFSAFKAVETKVANDHWFEVTPTGDFGAYIGTSTSLDCQQTEPETPLCAVRLNDNQVDNPNSPSPQPTISSPEMADEKRYQNED